MKAASHLRLRFFFKIMSLLPGPNIAVAPAFESQAREKKANAKKYETRNFEQDSRGFEPITFQFLIC